MFGASVPLLLESNGPEIFLDNVRAKIDTALQPITDIRSGAAHGFEALARNTSALGFPSIRDFFAFAERLDVRTEVDNFLYSKAASKLAEVDHGSDALLFINLDRQHARSLSENLQAFLKGLAKAGLSPSDVCVEITEGGDTSGFDGLLTAVDLLRRRGFRIAIDDFGTGFSGLQALYNLQPEYVKIDRFFINGLERDGRKRLFVSRVVELAHILGSKVVAEGVERVEELHACRDAGCDLVQGYFVARPSCDVSDIMPVYAAVVSNPDRRLSPRGALTLDTEGVVTALGTIPDDTRVESIVDFFLSNPDCSFIPVVDARAMPIGIIRERDLRSLVQSPFGRDLLKNDAFPMHIRDFVVRVPVVDEKICPNWLIDQCAQAIDEGIIVTSDMRYAGFVPSSALLRLAGMIRLRQARNQNPLTHLPANDAIRDFIIRACVDRSLEHMLCHLDFNHFKPFNDVYGFHVGDRAIIMFADLLRDEFGQDGAFLGHIGGDDFFVGASGPTPNLSQRLVDVTDRFARSAESLYGAEHRNSGYIECAGRDGVPARFPLLTCSIALLELPRGGGAVPPDEVSRELSHLKTAAKKSVSSFSCAIFSRDPGGPDRPACDCERIAS
jgi:EAL domain-containing protein (putative c-di-GMP-specific phosphodiesterase class I)/GGDEF domain-containing protein